MTRAVLDDHLLRDILVDAPNADLHRALRRRQPATTNLYYLRLCRSLAVAGGGKLTGGWPATRRQALGRVLAHLPETIEIVPLRTLAVHTAALAAEHRLSTLGAEAVAAAMHLDGPLCVWDGDDGPAIRRAASAVGVEYRVIGR